MVFAFVVLVESELEVVYVPSYDLWRFSGVEILKDVSSAPVSKDFPWLILAEELVWVALTKTKIRIT